MSIPAAGWYEAPSQPGVLLWWDGAKWAHDEAYRSVARAEQNQPAPTGERMQITGAIEPLR